MLSTLSVALICVLSHCVGASRPVHNVRDDVSSPLLVQSHSDLERSTGLQSDRVVEFPGEPGDRAFEAYAGYITVEEDAGRALYYVLVEAETDDPDAPVVLWLNGGPGCSSIGGGLFSELGPFYPTPSGETLTLNKYRWNRVANMVFLESPAFVGFSYSNSTEDMAVGDERTAADAVRFLTAFFDRHPHLAERPFWISGESYGGHYVPNLAAALLRHNEKHADDKIRLQGFLVGNAWTDATIDNTGAVDFWWAHAIVSDSARDGILKHCNMSDVGPLRTAASSPSSSLSALPSLDLPEAAPSKCDASVMYALQNMGNINIYDIYVDVCLPKRARLPAATLGSRLLAANAPAAGALGFHAAAMQHVTGHYDACIDNEVAVYLNRPEVQAALHANTSGTVAGPWADCSTLVNYSHTDLMSSMLPVYHELLDAGLDILVYSGDVDAIVPVIGTRRWIASLELEIEEPWRAWKTSSGQVGGYVEVYEKLTFATVRGAGHMVPFTQPERAFHMFERFVTGKSL